MDRLLKSTQVAEILQCSRDKALMLMSKMRHVDVSSGSCRRDLRVWEHDLLAYLADKTSEPQAKQRRTKKAQAPAKAGSKLIPYIKASS